MSLRSCHTRNSNRAVLFDWNYTLAVFAEEGSLEDRLLALLKRHHLNYHERDVVLAVAMLRTQALERGSTSSDAPRTSREFVSFYHNFLQLLGVDAVTSKGLAKSFYVEYGKLPVRFYNDSYSTLQTLFEKGYSLGVITNNSAAVRSKIESTIGHVVLSQNIIISQELGSHKPSKTIFRYAASRLHIQPSACVYVGDNLEIDACAAVAKGGYRMGIWLDRINRGPDFNLPPRVKRITHLEEVIELVRE